MDWTTEILSYLLVALVAYLIGSISFSIIFTRLFTHQDVREHGSGNAGATNVLRTAGVLPAVLTGVMDLLKAVAAVAAAWIVYCAMSGDGNGLSTLGSYLFVPHDLVFTHYLVKYIAGTACVLGHIFPVYFGFRGGKGILAASGAVLMIDWRVLLCCVAAFLIMVVIFRYVSVGSIAAACTLPLWTLLFQLSVRSPLTVPVTFFSALLGALLVWMHRGNIGRLRRGTELKLGQKAG